MVGQRAPAFGLPSIQGKTVALAAYQARVNVILWFSRGITCPFCRASMDGMIRGYPDLTANGIELVQVTPNLIESAKIFFDQKLPPYPFVCDPDKNLYAQYGLTDRGPLDATRNAVVSFSHAFSHRAGLETVRASWLEIANRHFVRRLHHHALTAVEQGVFIIDTQGIVRFQMKVGPIEPIPAPQRLLALTKTHCA